ncbi:ABC transporter permease subunit [Aneurinibacillus sp. Ricciae_BoGa-3]|uniref:ABC transporter permease n=1 Tax=Aneurinibacillus sp. Ricciae_BoGa-3 TaxID=3022697 RepID=UPI00233F9B06|nr:ABC transporter permease subunit [Aneurinibacillus sp. Ricciae_BoGa-3]WCK56548.1 ABC transporter permease subunit [Aneurinibacillus sp. Ricciae_BoGa-3]
MNDLIHCVANPVLGKELRVRMRSKKTPWIITLYLAALGIVIFSILFMQAANKNSYYSSNGKIIFVILSVMQYALIILATPGLTAGAISGERERQTLPLLLTTNLSGVQIILGKWLSSLSFMILLVLSSIPLYSMVLLFGGTSPGQFIKIFAVYLITMLAIGAVGLCISTIMKRTGAATVTTYLLVFAFSGLIFLISGLLYDSMQKDLLQIASQTGAAVHPISTHPLYGWLQLLNCINPFNVITVVFLNQNGLFSQQSPENPFWGFIVFYGIITIVALAVAVLFIRRKA